MDKNSVHPVVHGTRKQLTTITLNQCPCQTKRKPGMWNTGYWNISCPVCYRIVSKVYKANTIKAWNKLC